ncbi:MAG: hypothetical protein HXX11_14180 [Desulfuromonadales bacterium]|nr:hypothetical protein [Desulfuromonadales bacterium]
MKTIKMAIIPIMFGLATTFASAADSGEKNQATFAVGCFDVGASALQGKPGIIEVQKGWQGGREVNRVSYDSTQVSVNAMEAWLKRAGTYIATEPGSGQHSQKEK